MSHEIELLEKEDGTVQAAMSYSGEIPWHGLGIRVGEDATPEEIMKAASLDWKVRELSTFAEMNVDGKKKRLPTGMKALVRETDGKVLTQVGKNWHPVQNEEAFNFFKEFIDIGSMKMHTAGSLKGGEIIWALAKVDDDFEVFGGDKIESYLLFSNPHQYGKTIDVRFTPIRVVCNNTLTMALGTKAKSKVNVNHRKQFNPEEVKEMLGIAKFKMSNYKTVALELGKRKVSKDVMKTYFGELLGRSKKNEDKLSNTGELAMDVLDKQPGADFANGTMWQAYNTITYMTDHLLGRTADTRLQSAWFGSNNKLKMDALEKAREYAAAH